MTPEQEEQVRRALAAAARAEDQAADPEPTPDLERNQRLGQGRADDLGPGDLRPAQRRHAPIPPDVAARLDTVLEELVAPRVAAATPAGDELAARRARRWPNALVAAAALCVIALAGGAVATGGFGMNSDSATDATSATQAEKQTDGSGAASGLREAAPSERGRTSVPSAGDRSLAAAAGGPPLRRATLARDVQRLLDRPERVRTRGLAGSTCATPPRRAGELLVDVRLDGRRSTMVLGVPEDGRRTARVYSCSDPGTPVATATVRSSLTGD